MKLAKKVVAASTIAALIQRVSAASPSYYEHSDGLESVQAHANILASYYYYCGNGYYDWYYGYYESNCYDTYNTIDWGWFFIILCCCPVCIYYKYCHRRVQHSEEQGDTTNIIYNDNNFHRATDGTVQQVYYNPQQQMMMQPG